MEYLILNHSNSVLLHSVNILTNILFHQFFLYTFYRSCFELYSIVHANLLSGLLFWNINSNYTPNKV